MATKQQAINALKEHSRSATLIDESDGYGYSVKIEAPSGHHWDGDVHCRVVDYWYADGNKADYWLQVIDTINELPTAVSCDEGCELTQGDLPCEYWEEDNE